MQMAVKAGDLEHDLMESLGNSVGERLAGEQPSAYREFVRQYYHWVPAKDLADRRAMDLCGAVVAHWRTARTRGPGEAKVHVYNPKGERDGWESPYTVLEVVSDDMPFDSGTTSSETSGSVTFSPNQVTSRRCRSWRSRVEVVGRWLGSIGS